MKKVFFMFSILVLIVLVSYPADSAEAEIDLSSEQRKKIESKFLNLDPVNIIDITDAYNQLLNEDLQFAYSLEEVQKVASERTRVDIYKINEIRNTIALLMMEECSNSNGYDKQCFVDVSCQVLNEFIAEINSQQADPAESQNSIKNIFIAFLLANKRLLDGLMD